VDDKGESKGEYFRASSSRNAGGLGADDRKRCRTSPASRRRQKEVCFEANGSGSPCSTTRPHAHGPCAAEPRESVDCQDRGGGNSGSAPADGHSRFQQAIVNLIDTRGEAFSAKNCESRGWACNSPRTKPAANGSRPLGRRPRGGNREGRSMRNIFERFYPLRLRAAPHHPRGGGGHWTELRDARAERTADESSSKAENLAKRKQFNIELPLAARQRM